eukprot:5455795-Ditylum_brightwellii.AAC.1
MEVYGSVESTRYISSDTAVASALAYYDSAREVSNHINSIKTFDPNDCSFASVDQDALTGRLGLVSSMLYGCENEKAVLLDAYKRVIENAGECEVVM